jgi:hypothetical protein
MSNNRWSKFVWHDWRNDPALRLVGLPARGLWMELLCLAHEANPRGHVLIGGRKPTPGQLAKLVGESQHTATGEPQQRQDRAISRLINELVRANVCDITPDGVLVSRRMVRDEAIHQRAVSIGKLGGNPNVMGAKKGEKQVNQGVNQRRNGLVNPDSDSDSESPIVPSKPPNNRALGTTGAPKPSEQETPWESAERILTGMIEGPDPKQALIGLKRLAQYPTAAGRAAKERVKQLRQEAAANKAPFRETLH